MEWKFVIALVIAIPVVLFPAAVVWYLNVGGIYTAIKEVLSRRAACRRAAKGTAATVDVVENRMLPEDSTRSGVDS